ncbi:protein-ADP-ribose hydrolase [Clostridium sp. cel8]|jgi:O-acetyl-ADP-ribose deacetylase (regulator of RNase III)|uniref:protein-ADP-ribose hydrolase n=1 Tax=unclassified Clostridium TaxID=2614128 RepID=UPI0015F734C0|nr:protein-ADP-ribose hydrolase [Clostridium sp. cel8]MBA5851580.1 protein-ADP-ribose hydrolase [Clostridium sp. cel8]
MNQNERRLFLIDYLLKEDSRYSDIIIPSNIDDQKRLLRSLMNVRMPKKISYEFIKIQDEYLQEELKSKDVTDYKSLTPLQNEIYLWKGDITTLKIDGIVNAANSGMTGCYYPCHGCIDNVIHTYSGVQLRLECAEIMKIQQHEEPTGKAKITKAYNLPCKYIIHTVGPVVNGKLRKDDENLLASCYRSCLELANKNGLHSIAFCCISTGEFHFPNKRAAEIAVQTVRKFKKATGSRIDVVFNVFKEYDYEIYKKLLKTIGGCI